VLKHLSGDKVRIKQGPLKGLRGTLVRPQLEGWLVSTKDGDHEWVVSEVALTNFSLAARRAWQSMPDRKVGRPLGSKVSDRVSVTLRLDRNLWDSFRDAEDRGLIIDRTEIFNAWLRDYLHGLISQRRRKAS
jgi:uncharacterized protein (DUF4415 family)